MTSRLIDPEYPVYDLLRKSLSGRLTGNLRQKQLQFRTLPFRKHPSAAVNDLTTLNSSASSSPILLQNGRYHILRPAWLGYAIH